MILFNNKDILIGGKPFLFKEWLNKGIRTIMHLLDIYGDFLSFEDFKSKYSLKKTNFLHYYQVTSAICKSKEYETLSCRSREFEF